jgi:hypothetical protein
VKEGKGEGGETGRNICRIIKGKREGGETGRDRHARGNLKARHSFPLPDLKARHSFPLPEPLHLGVDLLLRWNPRPPSSAARARC